MRAFDFICCSLPHRKNTHACVFLLRSVGKVIATGLNRALLLKIVSHHLGNITVPSFFA